MTKAKAFESWKLWAEAAGRSWAMPVASVSGSALPGVDEGRLGKDRAKAFLGVGLRAEGSDGA